MISDLLQEDRDQLDFN